MYLPLLLITLLTPQPRLSSADVKAIVSQSVTEVVQRDKRVRLSRPFLVDTSDAGVQFTAITGGRLDVGQARWVDSIPSRNVDRRDVLVCPQASRVSPECRMAVAGTLVHLIRLEPHGDSDGYLVHLNFVHARTATDTSLGGFTAILHAQRSAEGWTTRLVARAAG